MDNIAKSLVLQAIQEGIALAPHVYAERLEQRLAFDVSLQEADGDVSAVLEEQMIDELLPYCEINESNGEINFDEELFYEKSAIVDPEFWRTYGDHLKQYGQAFADRTREVGGNIGRAAYDAKEAVGKWAGDVSQRTNDLVNTATTRVRNNLNPELAARNAGIDADNATRLAAYKSAQASIDRAGAPAQGLAGKLGVSQGTMNRVTHGINKVGEKLGKASEHVMTNKGAYALGAAGVAALAGGVYALYRHLNSPKKIQAAIEKTNAKLSQARKENDSKAAQKYDKKLKVLNMKMDALRKKGKA